MDPIGQEPVQLLRCQNFDAKVTGVKDLFDLKPTPMLCDAIWILLRDAANVTQVPTMSIGTNAPNYDNVCPAGALTGLDVPGEWFRIPVGTAVGTAGVRRGLSSSAGASVKANVTQAAQADVYIVEVIPQAGSV